MHNLAATTANLKDEAGGGEDIEHTNRKESKKERSKNKDKKRNHSRIGERILINYSIRVESDYHASHEGHCK
jgi:hypothetical protein